MLSASIPTTPLAEATPGLPDHQPAAQAERIQTLDILRGVALLGILLMNIFGPLE